MKIKNWENYITKKYNAKKVEDFLQLKKYLTNQLNYSHNFTPEEITETEILNDEYYAAYVFDENNISKKRLTTYHNSGWNTTIVFLASKDKINISNYFVHESNGVPRNAMNDFCKDIDPLGDEKSLLWVREL